MNSLIVQNVAPHETGVATGMSTNIGTAIVSSFVTCRLRADGLAAESGHTHGFTLLAVISVVAIGVALLIPTGHRDPNALLAIPPNQS
jgi:hypothetical protein